MQNKKIPFSPPDIREEDIKLVVETLKSGWITTGPKVREFEKKIALYCGSEKAICLNSATAGLELVLRMFDIGPGDEVITTPYTFAATSNVIVHTGAKPVFVDVKKESFHIDPEGIEKAISSRTKAIIPVDIGGFPCDYDEIYHVLKSKRKYRGKRGTLQNCFDRPIIIADSAHSFGASYKGKKIGNITDFTVFSFHAVKNLTTAEGGAITFNSFQGLSSEEIYKRLSLLSLHGQSKDAYSKYTGNSWRYTIEIAGYKCNMTDIAASLGLSQLNRYDTEILPSRKRIFEQYINLLKNDERFTLPYSNEFPSYHLFMLRIKNIKEKERDEIIKKMAEKNIFLNVHFIPVVMQPAYIKMGYNIKDFPNTYEMYRNEISLPVYTGLSSEDIELVCSNLKDCIR